MNINRSAAVDLFKQHGRFRYYGAQKLPIDAYKDIILLHEFAHHVMVLSHQWAHGQKQITHITQTRYQAYHDKNTEHPQYGWLIEMMYRRKITPEQIKNFLQSALLNTTNITYQTYDELKVYINGVAEWIGMIVADIIGCAPPCHPHAQALGEWIWLMHLLLDLDKNHDMHLYLPQADMHKFGISREDITYARYSGVPCQWIRDMVKHYIDEHEELSTYAVWWIWYLNKTWHLGVAELVKFYENYVVIIQSYDYNVFHPRFSVGVISKIMWYCTYRLYSLIWPKH